VTSSEQHQSVEDETTKLTGRLRAIAPAGS
jgi:hypothetical protein